MQKFTAVPVPVTGGVNRDADPRALGPDQMVLQGNAYPNLSGILQKRPACRPIAPLDIIGAQNIFIPDRATGAVLGGIYLASATTLRIGAVASMGAFDGVSVADVVGATKASWFNWRGFTFVCLGYPFEGFWAINQQSGPLAVTRVSFAYAGAGVTAQSQSIQICPATGTSYRGAAVWANFGPRRENQILISDRTSATHAPVLPAVQPLAAKVGTDALSINGRFLTIDHLRGDSIVGMKEIMLGDLSNQLQTGLLIWGKQRAVLATGIPLQTTDVAVPPQTYLNDFTPNILNRNAGILSPHAFASTPLGIFWVSGDNVWMMRSGSSPVPVGNAIRSEIRAVPSQFQHKIHAVFSKDKIIVGLPTGEEFFIAETGQAEPRINYWWLDLRDDLSTPPRWYGPMTYRTDGQLNGDFSGDPEGGVIWACVDENDSSGNVLGLNVESNDFESDATLVDLVSSTASGQAVDLSAVDEDSSGARYTAESAAITWASLTEYSVGQLVRPVTRNGHLYICNVAGTTAAVEPVWPIFPPTVGDGTVTWIEATTFSGGAYPRLDLVNGAASVQVDVRSRVTDWGAQNRRTALKVVDAELSTAEPSRVYCNDILDTGNRTEPMSVVVDRATNSDFSGSPLPLTGGNDSSHRAFRTDQVLISENHQLQFQDDTAFIVDDTNDALAFSIVCRLTGDGLEGCQGYFEGAVPHGAYATAQDLANAINIGLLDAMVQMNATPLLHLNQFTTPGLELSGGFWRFNLVQDLSSGFFDFCFPALLLGQVQIDQVINGGGVFTPIVPPPTIAFLKTRRLLALLGFNTDEVVPLATAAPVWAPAPFGLAGSSLLWPSSGSIPVTNLIYWASSHVYTEHPVAFELASAAASGIIQGGKPFTTRDR